MEVAPQAHVGLERRPQLPDVVQLAVHPALRQAIFRDPVAQHPPLLRLCLEDVAVVAAQLEVIGGSQAAWSCADDRHAASRLRVLRPGDRGRRVDFQHPIGAIAVAVANGDGGVDLLAAAVRLARRRADPAEDGWERQRALEDARRLLPVAQRVLLEVPRDVDPGRAFELAGRQAVRVVVGEDQLQHHPAVLDEPIRMGGDDHPFLDGRATRDGRVLASLDLDHADAACAVGGELGLIAERRHLEAQHSAGLQDGLPLLGLDLLPVDRDRQLPGPRHHGPYRGVILRAQPPVPVAVSVAVGHEGHGRILPGCPRGGLDVGDGCHERRDRLDAAGAGQADASLRMRSVLVRETFQRGQHRPGRKHLEVAERRVGHLARQVPEEVEVAGARRGFPCAAQCGRRTAGRGVAQDGLPGSQR